MNKTIYIKNEDVYKAAQRKAALLGVSISEVIEKHLTEWVFNCPTKESSKLQQIRKILDT